MTAQLVWRRGEDDLVEFPLDEDVLEVGRDEGVAIRIDEPLVSRRHARLERRDGVWTVRDLDSTTFTRVNGRRIRSEQELSDGDELQFARARCLFRTRPA